VTSITESRTVYLYPHGRKGNYDEVCAVGLIHWN